MIFTFAHTLVPAVPKERPSAFAGVNFSEKLLHFYDNHFFRIHFFFRKEVWGPCMRRQPIQEREPVREYRFFWGEGNLSPSFLKGRH